MDFLFKTVTLSVPKAGDLLEGLIIARKGAALFVSLDPFGTGIVYGREYYQARDLIKSLKTGDVVTAKVLNLENEDGYVELSLEQADKEMLWREAEELRKLKESVEIPVVEANKGGLVLAWKGLSGFLPASQLRASHYPRVEGGDKDKILEELKKLVGTTLTVTVLSVDSKEEKIIFSEKNVETAELKELVSQYHVGDVVQGEISGVVDFGVFIKIGEGLEGLAHISELDWGLVTDPTALFKEGEQIKAKIIGVSGGKISLSIKALKPDPWQLAAEKYHKGDIVQGVVVRLDKYGALVSLEEGIAGLSHVSEFASERDLRDKLELGKSYPFQVLNFDPSQRQLTLSFLGEQKTERVAKDAVPDDAQQDAGSGRNSGFGKEELSV
ncbi:MAG: S1 RNA-binding domain-containing protein [Parcubacteria group bacterium]|nr:S1 RNA-binding domain-containing protein [Parcubacteria group bacterium]